MKIDTYSFGKIVIDGRTYTSDVIIYPDHVDASWWRKEGHYLRPVDLTDVVKAKPAVLIIGTETQALWSYQRRPSTSLKHGG